MAATSDLIDIQAFIADFIANADCRSVELPRLTTGQRKYAKRLLEEHPEITCESFGFGQERRLHLFKAGDVPSETATVEPSSTSNTPEDSSQHNKNEIKCVMDGPVCKL